MKELADDNFKFDENSRQFYEWVVNTVGKEEIARYEQFLLFQQCFQRLIWERVKINHAMSCDFAWTGPFTYNGATGFKPHTSVPEW